MDGNTGHGHVFPRPDGVKARCGGPGLCAECARDFYRKMHEPATSDRPPASSFQRELETLINRHSMENGSNTPDFLLAEYLCDCLATYEVIMSKREKWYGRGIVRKAAE